MDRESHLTMLRTAKRRKIMEIQESLPSIRQQVERSVDDHLIETFNLLELLDTVRSLRLRAMGPEKPSDSLLAELATAERSLRLLGFDVVGTDKVFVGSEWRKNERDVLVESQLSSRLKDEREQHLKVYDDAMARVKATKTLRECREIVDSVLAA